MDTSLSMQQGERWQQAVEKAESLIDAMKPADQGLLVSADSRVRVAAGPVNGSDKAETAQRAGRHSSLGVRDASTTAC